MKTLNHYRVGIGVGLLLVLLPLMAAKKLDDAKPDTKIPIGCREIGYSFYLKTLNLVSSEGNARQAMFLFYNKAEEPLTLYQMRGAESSRSMYLNHVIGPKQWAVLATAEKRLKYTCTIPKAHSTYGEIVDCAQLLQVCQYNNVKFGLNNQGNYWLINSDTKNMAVNTIVRYGIIPGA